MDLKFRTVKVLFFIYSNMFKWGGEILDNNLSINIAKKETLQNIIIVEGYMDCVSLHQRGITNVVASLGTALTEAQRKVAKNLFWQNNNFIWRFWIA